jgi:mono/diheme cytochrome c family protein/rhodanese-related sulfurtransferase
MSRNPLRARALFVLTLSFAVCGCSHSQQEQASQPAKPAQPAAATAAAKPAAAPAPAAPTASVEQGAAVYARICSVCHGPGGEGYKADQAPALYHPDFLASVSDAYLRDAIHNGRRGSTMSAWSMQRGGPLTDRDIDSLIALMRSWQKLPHATLDESPPHGNVGNGATTYARECARCHGENGVEGPNIRIGDTTLQAGLSNGFLRYAISRGRDGTPMPRFAVTLGDQGVEDVLAFLRTLPAINAKAAMLAPPAVVPPPLPLGPVPLNPKGPEPRGFKTYPDTTPVEVVHAEFARGARMAFLDARAPSDYANEHIAGAVSVPFYDPSPYVAKLPKSAWLVCYCACPHAESGELAQKLMKQGFTKVTVLAEGLGFWKFKKYATTTGPKP